MKDKFSSLIRCNIKINTYDRVTVVLTTDGQAVLQKRKARIKKLKMTDIRPKSLCGPFKEACIQVFTRKPSGRRRGSWRAGWRGRCGGFE